MVQRRIYVVGFVRLRVCLWRRVDADKHLIALDAAHFDTYQHVSGIRQVVRELYVYLCHPTEIRNLADVFNDQWIGCLL